MILFLLACAPDESLELVSAEDPVAEVCATAECVRHGDEMFSYGGSERRVMAFFPENPAGAPVLFGWHYLSASPEEYLAWNPIDEAVDDGFVVVVPESRGLLGQEWDVSGPPSLNEDLVLFDALLDSLIEVQHIDPERVYATGFSAGGLFTTYLTLHRSERLAATAPFSGGAPSGTYVTPTNPLPVMVSWGGDTDTFGGFDFADASINLVDELVRDGHLVLSCEHSLGHLLPLDATARTLDFVGEHARTGAVASSGACVRMEP